ncbi:methyltransferase domain-containing protein [soil metagenome]
MSNTVANIEPIRREYDRLAPQYDRRWGHYVEATLGAVMNSLDFDGQERVLDLACGTGALEHRLLDRWPALQVVGADLSGGMLQEAASKALAGVVGWVQADARRLPFSDSTFDTVLCASSFHYFRSPVASLVEIRRLLRPGGRLLLVDWCDDYLSCKLCSLWLRITDPAFHRTYALRECRSLLEGANFEVVEAEPFKVDWLWGLMRLVGRSP